MYGGLVDTQKKQYKNRFYLKIQVLFYVDKNFQKKLDHSVKGKIFDPSEIKKYSNPIFIASSTYWHEIYQQIQDMGIDKNRVINTMVI